MFKTDISRAGLKRVNEPSLLYGRGGEFIVTVKKIVYFFLNRHQQSSISWNRGSKKYKVSTSFTAFIA